LKNYYRIIGTMSGTSLDGLDMALATFERENPESAWSFSIEKTQTVPYSKELKEALKHAISYSSDQIIRLDWQLGEFMAMAIQRFKYGVGPVDFVASHGHTIFHQPDKGVTLQIGSAQKIQVITGLPVVNNFRQADVKAGGQGAPLVPIGDRDLFGDFDSALNLGGIANISFDYQGQRIAYDICPFNMALNELASQLGHEFDYAGKMAASGTVNSSLLERLNQIEYLKKPWPKSLGLEDYKAFWKPELDHSDGRIEDKLATCVIHAVEQIGAALNQFDKKRVLITGGGAYNRHFIESLQQYCSNCEIVIPEKTVIEFKEALVFAYLGLLRVEGQPNCLASVTGARNDVLGGDLIGF
tara:strand:- start:4575 stop:5642 length:1068 start_codon:yes stop_codon:yes gene_type:complete